MPDATSDQQRMLSLVRRFGWNATSFQVLEPGFRYFFVDDDACVAFVDTGRAWVAAGAPLSAPNRFPEVTNTFVAEARRAHRRACFFATQSRFADAVPLCSLLVGEQAEWDPAAWPTTLRSRASLREQLRRARAKGVRVRLTTREEMTNPASPTRRAVEALIRRWLGTREMAPMGFLVQVAPLTLLADHRLFVAELATEPPRLVGFLSASPIFARRGWLFQNLLRAPDAPNGTGELLVDHAMRVVADEPETMVTLGMSPLAGELSKGLRLAKAAGAVLFDFEGLHAFKSKLQPQRWQPIFLSYPREQSVAASLYDVLAAFAHGHLLRFGVETLLRGPAVVVWMLASMLVPWTLLLAQTDATRWFPSPAVKWAWVTFDCVLTVCLFALAHRWRDGLSRVLTAAVIVDATLTAMEAGHWYSSHPSASWRERTVVAIAVAAPTLAAVILWRARIRRRAPRDLEAE